MRVVIYARVSSTEQLSGYSIDAQIDLSRSWATQHGHEVVAVFVEPGKSAKTDQRPEFQKMIRRARRGEFGAILVHKMDRFARNQLDLLYHKNDLAEYEVRLWSATEEFLNAEGPETDFIVGVMGAMAQYVAHNIGNEARKGLEAKLRAGRWPGARLTMGYIRHGQGKQSSIEIEPDQGRIIRRAFAAFSSGDYNIRQWATEAAERGYRGAQGQIISKSVWQRIFRNNFYVGEFTWKNEVHQGDHPALIDCDTWQAVQAVLDDHATGGSETRHFWLLRDLLWSEVHSRPMTGSRSTGGSGQQYTYYRAEPRQRNEQEHAIRAEAAEAQVVELLAQLHWDRQTPIPAPDRWLFGLGSAPHLGWCWPNLRTPPDRHDFLTMVFLSHGLSVNAAGRISTTGLRPGFKKGV